MRKIIHVDMDCFYAAVETKHNASLRGRPVAVGGPAQSRSVLCTANYEARRFGVRSAMPSAMAQRLCPDLVIVPPNFALYQRESECIRRIFADFTERLEPLSLDEAYLDVTDTEDCRGSATLIAQEIRRRIWRETGLAASAGVAPNKFLAKVASDINKPNGLCVIPPSEVAAFMPQLKIEKIPGVGRVTARRMHLRGLRLCGDLQRLSEEQLIDDFGKWGRALYRLCRGEDHRPVEASFERKSLSVEETFPRDITRLDDLLGKMPELFMDWARRMERRDHRERIQGAFVKLKFCDFTATTVERRSLAPTQENFKSLFRTAWGRRNLPIRLAGLGARLGDPADGGAVEQLALPLSDCG